MLEDIVGRLCTGAPSAKIKQQKGMFSSLGSYLRNDLFPSITSRQQGFHGWSRFERCGL